MNNPFQNALPQLKRATPLASQLRRSASLRSEPRLTTLRPTSIQDFANSDGVTVSTFEWEQNLKGEHWSEKEANGIVEQAMSLKTDLRRAAFVIALERIQEAMKI